MTYLTSNAPQLLQGYLDFFKLNVSDFFINDSSKSDQFVVACLEFAKSNLLNTHELRDRLTENHASRVDRHQKSILSFFTLMVHAANIKVGKDAASIMMNYVTSFERTNLLLSIRGKVEPGVWESLFAKNWPACDGCSFYSDEIIQALSESDLAEIRKNLSEDDIKTYLALPDQITIYRGSILAEDITSGVSWTLSKDIANKFARIAHNVVNYDPSALRHILGLGGLMDDICAMNSVGGAVLCATIPKKNILYTNCLNEEEVILTYNIPFSEIEVSQLI